MLIFWYIFLEMYVDKWFEKKSICKWSGSKEHTGLNHSHFIFWFKLPENALFFFFFPKPNKIFQKMDFYLGLGFVVF